jgi:hypothetical protein
MLSTVHVLPLRLSASRPVALPTAMHEAVAVQDTALNCQTDAPETGGVVCCSQLADAGCAITRTAVTTSAAVIAIRFIAIAIPRSSLRLVPRDAPPR